MESHEKEENAIVMEADRMVEYVRMCTKTELKEISEKIARSDVSRDSKLSEQAQEKVQQRMMHLFYDALAVAGTQNTIKVSPIFSRNVQYFMFVLVPHREDLQQRNPGDQGRNCAEGTSWTARTV